MVDDGGRKIILPTAGIGMDDLEQRYKNICLKLWGEQQGNEIHSWIIDNRPPHFQRKLMEVMVPIWEMEKVDLKTKILCCISAFTSHGRSEVEFFLKMAYAHKIPKSEVEEILLLVGLEFGFPNAEMTIGVLQEVYDIQ
jgi:alkylhydroperoxidase/carboxymuconolactone decarboxylase family protein YurZ